MSALIDTIAARSGRERLLLALALLVGVPALAWLALVEPARDARHRAEAALAEARAVNEWVAARAAELPRDGDAPRAATAPIGVAGIESSLIDAGLRGDVSDLAEGDDGRVTLRFDEVTFQSLARWLSAQNAAWGYDIAAFQIERTDEPGRVAAGFTLAPAGRAN